MPHEMYRRSATCQAKPIGDMTTRDSSPLRRCCQAIKVRQRRTTLPDVAGATCRRTRPLVSLASCYLHKHIYLTRTIQVMLQQIWLQYLIILEFNYL